MDSLKKIISPEVAAALQRAVPVGTDLYLVGGAVRDALLGIRPHDLDFCLSGKEAATARRTAEILGAAFYPLDPERGNYRVIVRGMHQKRTTIDFAGLRGNDITADLQSRDYSINAMAIELNSGTLYDPTGGAQDLKDRILRQASPTSFKDDPVRILRGLRLAPQFNLRIDKRTRQAMSSGMPDLQLVSPERIRDEVFRILESSHPAVSFRLLEHLGGLPVLFPEMVPLLGASQTRPHTLDVWNHTLAVMEQLNLLLGLLACEAYQPEKGNLVLALTSHRLGRFRAKLTDHFNQEISYGRTLAGLLMLAALYHDSGKPTTASLDENGRIHNYTHEHVSAEIVEQKGRQLQLSRVESQRLKVIVKNHMRIHSLAASKQPPSRRAIFRFFRDTADAGIDVCLLTLADTLGTYGSQIPQDKWIDYLEICRTMLEAWWEKNPEQVNPTLLLNGNDLQDLFKIEPGPAVGKLLEALKEGQADGSIQTRMEAVRFIEDLMKSKH